MKNTGRLKAELDWLMDQYDRISLIDYIANALQRLSERRGKAGVNVERENW